MTSTSSLFSQLTSGDGTFTILRIATALVVSITYGYYYFRYSKAESSGIYQLPGIHIFAAWSFFEKRHDFLWSHFPSHQFFQFQVTQHTVVALSGEEARKVFFSHHNLSSQEGYKIMLGGAPRLENIDLKIEETKQEDMSFINKYLIRLMNKDRLKDVFPTLLSDINKRTDTWGKAGRINPFVDVYELVFQMTARMATCRDIAEDKATVDRIANLFMSLQKNSTPAALIFPWFARRAKKTITEATNTLFMMVTEYVEVRRTKTPTSDAIDVLIAEGLDNTVIVGWVLGVMFAGVLNTGINACWILINLAIHPQWKEKVHQEALDLITKYSGPETSGALLHERLASVPLPAWENEMPVLDAFMHETLRITLNGIAFRRNLYEDISIGDAVIKKGAFMAYSLADAHLNNALYPDPQKFDPERSAMGDRNSKVVYPFLGWGAGRRPCSGMKVAKLEMKITTALFVLGYDYKLVDQSGKYPTPLPRPDYNNIHQALPVGPPCYLEYTRVMA